LSNNDLNKRTILFIAYLLAVQAPAFAQQEDTLYYTIPEVTLTEHRNISAISGTMASGIRIDSKIMQTYPKIFGYTDPMRYLQSLPGVSTNSDQEGGLHVQGGESSHNQLTVSDVPVYGSMNFTGLFSLFNQDHLPTVEFSTTSRSAWLGARLSMDHADTIPHRLSGTASLGLISGQTTVCAPLSDRTALTLSVRRSFINTFYGSVFKYDGNPLRFGFTDANLTLLSRLDSRNTLDFNVLFNHDKGSSVYGLTKISMDCTWGNTLASVRWRHHGSRVSSSTSAFISKYAMKGNMDNSLAKGSMPAQITHYGLQTSIKLPLAFVLEADANRYDILPQDPRVSINMEGAAPQPRQDALLGNIYVNRMFKLGHGFGITPHLLLSGYTEKGIYDCFNADPSVTFEYNMYRKGKLTLESGIRHQYLSQTGISNVGLPIEFWVAAGRYFKPQSSRFATLSYDLEFLQSKYAFSIQAYAKRLENQTEYTGFIYDLIARPYRLEDNLLICSGYNYGLNVMLARQAGSVTGWISYSYGQSLRQGDGVLYPKLFHSSHERRHELNAVLTYTIGRFELGGSYILGSGSPFTPAKNLYLMGNNLIIFYDDYNSATLPPYMRLDLSATYNLPRKGRLEHSLNLSVFNATAHKNYTMGYINANPDKLTIRYKLAKLIIPVIPSISYSCRF
jgi:hypothetical protein